MFTTKRIADPLSSRKKKMILDCREMDFLTSGSTVADLVVAWVTNFPQPQAMNVYLPSAAPDVRRLQCTLLSLGCHVFRVTK
jgi:hypothetical protein